MMHGQANIKPMFLFFIFIVVGQVKRCAIAMALFSAWNCAVYTA
jgi:hypothetical protein